MNRIMSACPKFRLLQLCWCCVCRRLECVYVCARMFTYQDKPRCHNSRPCYFWLCCRQQCRNMDMSNEIPQLYTHKKVFNQPHVDCIYFIQKNINAKDIFPHILISSHHLLVGELLGWFDGKVDGSPLGHVGVAEGSEDG